MLAFCPEKLFECQDIYPLAAGIVRAIISAGYFIGLLKNAMFGLMQLLEHIKTVWCVPISTL